ncbi:hypothetical protein [Sporolactobacillus terrae]|uniref:Uncharacterized protein n=1 Tax=Sporolactobacillus terrae TaxID=269673 RepID=A0A5K7WT39_9BACL|nr:hypothetical protein [Sporolactobacillus terrae]BBN97507.1 hypothetical protein St703_02120 [Sporolactobacillus terrae]
MPVSEMLARISSKELTEWKAYYKIKEDMQKEEERKMQAKYGKHNKSTTLGT